MNYAIIAAGEGSRLRQEGVELPKPLVMLDGRPMIERLIDIFMSCNPESLTIIVNQQMTEVADFLRTLRLPVPLNLVVKSTPSSMHSFHEVSRALPAAATGGKLCLTTVDTIFRQPDFLRFIAAFEADSEADGYMAVTPFVDDEKPLYVATSPDLDITGFLDAPAEGVKYVSGGIYGLTAPAIRVLDDCMERGISRMRNYQRALVEAGLRLKAYPIDKIVDVDHAADIPAAEAFIRS